MLTNKKGKVKHPSFIKTSSLLEDIITGLNIASFNKENISNEIQKPSIKKEITREELIEKKDEKLEKFDVLEKDKY